VKTRTGAVGAIVAVLLAAVTLSGCGNIDAGSGAADDFERFMSEQEHITGATGRGTNDLPWHGSPSGNVTVRDDISADDLETVVDMLGEYYVDHDRGNLDWKNIAVDIGDFRLDVEKTKSLNDDLRALFEEIRENPDYHGGRVRLGQVELAVEGDPSVDTLDLLNSAFADLEDYFVEYTDIEGRPALSDTISVVFHRADGSEQFVFTQSGVDARSDAGIVAFQALLASSPIDFARISSTRFQVYMVDEASVPAADALARSLLVSYAPDEIHVQGPSD